MIKIKYVHIKIDNILMFLNIFHVQTVNYILYFFFIFSSTCYCGTQSTVGSANRHGCDARMSRRIVSKIDQLLGPKQDENADGRVR